jgi:hypothetical protein
METSNPSMIPFMPRSLHALAAVAVLTLAASCATTRCGPSQPESGQALLDFEHR